MSASRRRVGHTRAVEVAGDAGRQAAGFASDIVDDNRDNRPPELLELGPACLVAQHLRRSRVPLDAFVFGRETHVGPGEVDSPHFTTVAVYRVLKFGQRQPVVDHDEPSLALHGRFRASVGEG